jgi:hypothetical protein
MKKLTGVAEEEIKETDPEENSAPFNSTINVLDPDTS